MSLISLSMNEINEQGRNLNTRLLNVLFGKSSESSKTINVFKLKDDCKYFKF